jgi:hypothetical protein
MIVMEMRKKCCFFMQRNKPRESEKRAEYNESEEQKTVRANREKQAE